MTAVVPAGPNGTVVTVGTFDGVHLGHREVLAEIQRRAEAAGRRSVLVTFEPHPLRVVNPAAAPPLLTTPPERREILAQTGVDYAIFVRFDRALASMPPEDFVRQVLVARYGMQELVIGYDHGFGRGRSGDVETLRRLGATDGFAVDVVEAVGEDGYAVSSTHIRRAVAGGDLATARRLLGRGYSVSAGVVRGNGRGREIGFPTANLGVDQDKLLPPDGVYAAWVECGAGRYGAMLNQGTRPTFADSGRTLEVHLIGYDGDLYDSWLKVEWVERLRDIRQFGSPAELRDQLARDSKAAEGILHQSSPAGT